MTDLGLNDIKNHNNYDFIGAEVLNKGQGPNLRQRENKIGISFLALVRFEPAPVLH